MDQRSVESLIHRLIERVEESERRYGEALDELHARLDHLSQTTDAARETGSAEDVAAFDRLHTQVSSLARRFEDESQSALDDFERLGKVLSGAAEPHDYLGSSSEATPAPAPEAGRSDFGFGQPSYPLPVIQPDAPETSTPYASGLAALAPAFGTEDFSSSSVNLSYGSTESFTPTYAPPPETPLPSYSAPADEAFPGGQEAHFDKRLVELAERLESSIGSLPAPAIEDLNARLDEIGRQLSHALEQGAKGERLEHIEKQISEMGQQLGRAELQLAKMGSIETQLLKLIERFDVSQTRGPAQLDSLQLTKIAKEAAAEAVRAASEAPSGTAERLDAMHRDLMQMSDRNRDSDDRLAASVKSVHESLKQLVQQAERNAPVFPPKPQLPFAERPRMGAMLTPPQQGPGPHMHAEKAAAPAKGGAKGASVAAAMDKPPRNRLGAAIPDFQDGETPPPFGRSKRAMPDEDAVDLDASAARRSRSIPGHDLEPDRPDDLVAAARRAAQAAALKAEARRSKKGRAASILAGSAPAEGEAPSRRKRSLLMIAAAILLILSALLLYGRLKSKPESEIAPPAAEETMPAPSDSTDGATPPAGQDGSLLPPAEPTPAEPPAKSGAWEIIPQEESPGDNAATGAIDPASSESSEADGTTGFSEIVKSSPSIVPAPTSELRPEPQPVSVKSEESPTLPPGVIFSVEEPALGPASSDAAEP